MNLYFQFITQSKSASALNLIQWPALLVSKQPIGGKIKMSSGGKRFYFKFSNLETLSHKMANVRFNEMELIYDVKSIKLDFKYIKVNFFNGVFYPLPTSELWFPSKDFPDLEDLRSRQRKTSAKSREEAFLYYEIASAPCVFEAALEIANPYSQDLILDKFAEWLAYYFGQRFNKCKIFGCCDAGGENFQVRLERYVPMIENSRVMARTHPNQYSELGNRIENLHPIMFGSRELYSRIATALGSNARLIGNNGSCDFVVIRLKPNCNLSVAKARVQKWLLSDTPFFKTEDKR